MSNAARSFKIFYRVNEARQSVEVNFLTAASSFLLSTFRGRGENSFS